MKTESAFVDRCIPCPKCFGPAGWTILLNEDGSFQEEYIECDGCGYCEVNGSDVKQDALYDSPDAIPCPACRGTLWGYGHFDASLKVIGVECIDCGYTEVDGVATKLGNQNRMTGMNDPKVRRWSGANQFSLWSSFTRAESN